VLSPITNQDLILALVKIAFVIGAFFYLIYSFVVAKQIRIMEKTLITGFSSIITLLGYVNLTIAILTLLGFLLFL
jgi:hypothetical protein